MNPPSRSRHPQGHTERMEQSATVRVAYTRDTDLNFEALLILDEDTAEVLEIQRSLRFDEQDRANGEDTYCLVASAGPTHYGGLAEWSLEDGVLHLTLTAQAAATLELEEQLQLPVGAEEEEVVREHLAGLVGAPPQPRPAPA